MLYSYKNSCFGFVTINVKVWDYPLISILADVLFVSAQGNLDGILTSLVLKAYFPFANEKDLTHIIWYPSNQIG